MALNTAQLQFIRWLQDHEPILFDIAVERAAMEGQSVGDYQELGGWFDSIVGSVTTALPKIADTVTKIAPQIIQYKLGREQLKRAQEGRPPIDTTPYFPVPIVPPSPIPPAALPQPTIIRQQADRAQQGLPPQPVYDYSSLFTEAPSVTAKRLSGKAVAKVAEESRKFDIPTWALPVGMAAMLFMMKR